MDRLAPFLTQLPSTSPSLAHRAGEGKGKKEMAVHRPTSSLSHMLVGISEGEGGPGCGESGPTEYQLPGQRTQMETGSLKFLSTPSFPTPAPAVSGYSVGSV